MILAQVCLLSNYGWLAHKHLALRGKLVARSLMLLPYWASFLHPPLQPSLKVVVFMLSSTCFGEYRHTQIWHTFPQIHFTCGSSLEWPKLSKVVLVSLWPLVYANPAAHPRVPQAVVLSPTIEHIKHILCCKQHAPRESPHTHHFPLCTSAQTEIYSILC